MTLQFLNTILLFVIAVANLTILYALWQRMPEDEQEVVKEQIKALKPKLSDNTRVYEWMPQESEEELAFKEGTKNLSK